MILLLSTSDTELLSAKARDVARRLANPARTTAADLPALVDGTDLVVVRLLGGRRAWEEGLDALLAGPRPVVVVSGEQAADAALMELATVPAGVSAQAHAYLAQGGADNLTNLYRFLSDTLLLTGHGFEPPAEVPTWGRLERESRNPDAPAVGVLYYRAHHLAGNTAFVGTLCDAIENAGGRAVPIWCASLRGADPALFEAIADVDALLVTVLAAGGARPAEVSAGGDDEAWDVGALAALDITVLQALSLTTSRAEWEAGDAGLSPMDA
ncbi:MAG: cobaltochelatase subunit CobN, partial [Streptomycetaceae bacterium]|nr:cobaltochelatase subunit CobN [Streptomycetaceae bacterium]